MVLCLFNLAVPTDEWLKEHDLEIGARCKACGDEASWEHVGGDQCEKCANTSTFTKQEAWGCIRETLPKPEQYGFFEGVKGYIGGVLQSAATQIFVEGSGRNKTPSGPRRQA